MVKSNLPKLCYFLIRGERFGEEIGIIKRDVMGYYLSPGMTREAADEENRIMGVSSAQRIAMELGSMFGWNIPAADPATHSNARSIVAESGPSVIPKA